MNVKPLFKLMVDKKASDLFFTTHAPVMIKIDGKIVPVNQMELSPKMVRQAALELMNEAQLEKFTRDLEIDFAISEPGLGRFRVNIFHQRGNVGMVMRFITPELPNLDDLGMPPILKDMVMLRRGLLLMVGASGSGKSTTLAAMIDYRNQNSASHIVTIEDPIEFLHANRKSIVNQREVGLDTHSYEAALRSSPPSPRELDSTLNQLRATAGLLQALSGDAASTANAEALRAIWTKLGGHHVSAADGHADEPAPATASEPRVPAAVPAAPEEHVDASTASSDPAPKSRPRAARRRPRPHP